VSAEENAQRLADVEKSVRMLESAVVHMTKVLQRVLDTDALEADTGVVE